ncbi:unnamed protein product [Paramecium pentaurelia]|uniref:Transmembrane protein n=1 Tax=Paramecium pentaurelia TaxID=43138 RepID=A0A8S1SKF6_9CILI|nr:unnamed protein product [Paramecium pentaurelia]
MQDIDKQSILILIVLGFIELVMLIILIYYLRKINQNRHCYPIYQLSPYTTILQGISFYLFQLMIVINLYLTKTYGEITWQICLDQNTNEFQDSIYQTLSYQVLTIIYLYSRGCCFTFTLIKSLRVLRAFSKQRLLKNNLIVKIYMNENFLIVIALFYGMFFPVLTIFTNLYLYEFQFYCCLQVYENNTGFVLYNSLLEEILTLYLMRKIKYNNYDDNLINLTIKLQFYYICWFALNSLIFKLLKFGPDIVGISCLIRCFFMFYNFTCIPLKNKQDHPNLYITYNQILDFQLISSKVFNNYYQNNYSLIAFENYLSKSNRIAITQTEIEFIAQRQNFTEIELFNKYLTVVKLSSSCQDFHLLADEIIKILNLQPTQINPYSTIDILQNDLYNHFESIYRLYFQQTVAFQAIKELTFHNQIIQENFKILRMPLNEWNYFDKFNQC